MFMNSQESIELARRVREDFPSWAEAKKAGRVKVVPLTSGNRNNVDKR